MLRRPITLALLVAASLSLGCQGHPLATERDEVAKQLIANYVERGAEALNELGALAGSENPLIRARAVEAIGRITGQWGSAADGIIWKRSVDDAINADRPLLVLQLFGKFNEEFC